MSATVLGALSDAERVRLAADDLEVTAVPLQQLVIHLTQRTAT
jgi:hypothetical protein